MMSSSVYITYIRLRQHINNDGTTRPERHSVLNGDQVDNVNNRPSYSGPGYHYYFTAELVRPHHRRTIWWKNVEWDDDGEGRCE
jgi:hypothetical protein